MKTYFIPIITSIVFLGTYFAILPTTITQENNLSKHCNIPYDVNFIERRSVLPSPNDEKPHYSIAEEFSIFNTVPIGEFRVDELAHSLILKPVSTSHG